jgi:hypothetical protein
LERQWFTNYIEMKYTQININQFWKNLGANCLPSDWLATTYLMVNDVIPNSQKLRAHRIADGNVFYSRCNYLDNNVHCLRDLVLADELTQNETQSDNKRPRRTPGNESG